MFESYSNTMEPTAQPMTPQESLDLITSMIRQAQRNVQQSSYYFLLWGWVVALSHASAYVLLMMDYRRPYLVWLLTIPAWIITVYKSRQQGRTARSVSHLDHITWALWTSIGICIFTLVA